MKISPKWLHELIDVKVDDRRLAEDLTAVGMAVEKYYDDGTWEIEITTNRVDAMNHYGIAREASAIYDIDLKPLDPTWSGQKQAVKRGAPSGAASNPGTSGIRVTIDVPQYCARFTG